MIRSKWRTLLKAASTETAVLALVRAFVAAWSADEVAAIDPDIWPSRLRAPRDVARSAVAIAKAHAEFSGRVRDLALLQELLLFMTQASVRMMAVTYVGPPASAGARLAATEPEEGFGGPVPRTAPATNVADDA